MRTPTAAELLDAWERGRARPPVSRALALLAAAFPEAPPDALADLLIGERDANLLELRERTFGPRLAALARCPACAQGLDLAFAVADVRAPRPPEGELSLTAAGHELRYRLPTSRDLIAVAAAGAPDLRLALLKRCVIEARHSGESRAAEE